MGEVGYKTLAIDIETFSDVDLIKCGVYAYADSPAFEILLFAYSFDDEETKIIDLAQGEQLTEEIKNALSDVGIIKTAFNANFERTCLSKYMGVRLSPESWVCTAVQSAMLALPLSLEGVGAVLGLSEQKLKEGKDLIRYFCVPCKPTKLNIINIPMLCTYTHDIYKKFSDMNDPNAIAYHELNVRELKEYFDKQNKMPLKDRVNIILMLFPVNDKNELVINLHKRLWHMQNI